MPSYFVLLGPPGAGKGTQAEILSEKVGLAHVSSGELFRENIKNQTELGKQVDAILKRGDLVPDDVTILMIRDRLTQPDCKNGAVLDGFPRTPAQAEALNAMLNDFGGKVDVVPYIQVDEEELVRRLSGRWVCRANGHTYHETFNPPKKQGVCDIDGSELYQRDDDKRETVQKRVKVYFQQTAPLIEHYRHEGVLTEINGDQPIDKVTADLLKAMPKEVGKWSWERNIVLKSSAELELMKQAGHINALALAEVRKNIRPGVTTEKLDKIAEQVIHDHGGEPAFLNYPGPYPYPGTLNTSVNEQLVHGLPGKRELKDGDIFSVDCGTVYKGFVGDSAFTTGIGKINSEAQKLIDVTEKALQLGIDKLRAGNHLGDVSAAIQKWVEGNGYHVPREYTGHGVGRQMHEGPQVPNYGLAGQGLVMRPGLTIALEPMVLVGTHRTRVLKDQWTVVSADGSLTAHFEHSVAVTDGDPLILTQ